MTRRFAQFTFSICLIAAGFVVASLSAETRFAGSAGFDLTAYGFTGSLHNRAYEYDTKRSISNHFFDANLSGNVVNQSFARYMLRGRLLGTLSQSFASGVTNNFYLTPELNTYHGSLTLFPNRRYPIRVFRGQQSDRSLEYEQQNRTTTDAVRPSLSVVRRYIREATQTGAEFSFRFSPSGTLSAGTRRTETSSLREYDFGEDRDIWVNVSELPPDPLLDRFTLEVKNDLSDADVRIIVDGSDTTIAPGDYVRIVVDSGFQRVTILPLEKYNQYEFTVRVRGDQVWEVLYKEPLSPRDQKGEETGQRVQVGLGETKGRTLNAFFESTSRFDPTTSQATERRTANNAIDYSLSKIDLLRMETGYSLNESSINQVKGQKTQSFNHRSSFEHRPSRGLIAYAKHEYIRTTSDLSSMRFIMNENRLQTNLAMPFKRLEWRSELRNNFSLKNDNLNTFSNQYDFSVINQMATRYSGFRWQPSNTSTYTIRDRKRSDGSTFQTKIIETSFTFSGTSLRPTLLGNIILKGNVNVRNQQDEIGTDNRKIYGYDILISRDLFGNIQLQLMTLQLWETLGGSAPLQPTSADGVGSLSSSTEHKQTYRADLRMAPTADMLLGFGYSLTDERLSRIGQITAMLTTLIPFVRLPFTSNLVSSTRDLADLPSQKTFEISNRLDHQFRRIVLKLEHKYSREELVSQTFSFYEIRGSLARRF